MSQQPQGGLPAALAIIGACMIWGLSAIYYKALSHIPPTEVLAHRTFWSALFFALFCMATGRLPGIMAILRDPRQVLLLAVTAVMISINWALFIWAVSAGHVVESSLGYYIFPLVMAALGWAVHGERFAPLQRAAVALAALATLGLSIGLGAPPYVSLTLAVTFAIYGLIKKSAPSGPISSVTVEVLLLAPFALVWLVGIHTLGWSDFSGKPGGAFLLSWRDAGLLAFSGLLTGAPLALYSMAAQRLPMSTVGLIAYLNPTLQFLVAVTVMGETVTIWHAIAFPMIWAALALYSLDALRRDRVSRRARRAAGAGAAALGAPGPVEARD
ncbi:MAG: chloramphenicol-sensitive protein RarD [Paracoccaceae bacterium]|jgi:chloramphenicol-sensitive protein RarD